MVCIPNKYIGVCWVLEIICCKTWGLCIMEHGLTQPFACEHYCELLSLASAMGWAGGAREQAGGCDIRAPEALTRLPTGWAQAVRLHWPSPPSPPNQPNGSGSHPGHSLWDLLPLFGWLEEFEGSLGPGTWLSQPWQLDSIWGGREWSTEICFHFDRTWTSEAENCAWRSCPFWSEQRIIFLWWRFTGI